MSVEQHVFTNESLQSSQHADGSASSSPSPIQSSPNKSFERADISKFDSCTNGNLVRCESLNTSGDLSTNPASRSSCTSPPFAKQSAMSAANG